MHASASNVRARTHPFWELSEGRHYRRTWFFSAKWSNDAPAKLSPGPSATKQCWTMETGRLEEIQIRVSGVLWKIWFGEIFFGFVITSPSTVCCKNFAALKKFIEKWAHVYTHRHVKMTLSGFLRSFRKPQEESGSSGTFWSAFANFGKKSTSVRLRFLIPHRNLSNCCPKNGKGDFFYFLPFSQPRTVPGHFFSKRLTL